MLKLTESQIEWWKKRWWIEEQYACIYQEKIPLAQVESAIERVSRVFDASWGARVGFHPVHYWLLSQGASPLQFLLSLGKDLEAVEGSKGLRRIIEDLRLPQEFDSTLFELNLAALLSRSGHRIEFRPALPNGKESDFVAIKGRQQVFFELKKMRESQAQLAIEAFRSRLLSALVDLCFATDAPMAGLHFNIELDAGLLNTFCGDISVNTHLIDGLVDQIKSQIIEKAKKKEFVFEIPAVGKFVLDSTIGPQNSGISSPRVHASAEIRRILSSHLVDAISQLNPAFPGIIIIQSDGALDKDLSQVVVSSMLTSIGPAAQHVSAIIFLPVIYSLSQKWALFNPFVVSNPSAKIDILEVDVFKDLSLERVS